MSERTRYFVLRSYTPRDLWDTRIIGTAGQLASWLDKMFANKSVIFTRSPDDAPDDEDACVTRADIEAALLSERAHEIEFYDEDDAYIVSPTWWTPEA